MYTTLPHQVSKQVIPQEIQNTAGYLLQKQRREGTIPMLVQCPERVLYLWKQVSTRGKEIKKEIK